MAAFRTLDDLGDVRGKVALVRVDLNVPMQDGRATDLTRIEAVAPTILELADAGAKVLLLAHFGRPKGERSSTMSLSLVQGAVEGVRGGGHGDPSGGRNRYRSRYRGRAPAQQPVAHLFDRSGPAGARHCRCKPGTNPPGPGLAGTRATAGRRQITATARRPRCPRGGS